MKDYFGIEIEYTKKEVDRCLVENFSSKRKGYVCVVDGNVFATCYKNVEYKKIVNDSTINICDGSSIALLVKMMYCENVKTYTGPELFESYVTKPFKQMFLGNTNSIHKAIKSKLLNMGLNLENYVFDELPFKNVNDFNYGAISENIRKIKPEIIWVSLGAPKQEQFISNLFPLIDNGMLIGIGAAFNLYLNDEKNKRAPKILRDYRLEWLYRAIKEPKRIGKRALKYLIVLPAIIIAELKRKRKIG